MVQNGINQYGNHYNAAMNTYNQETQNIVNAFQAKRLQQEKQYRDYQNQLEQRRMQLNEAVARKTQLCDAAEQPIGHTI